MYGEPRASHNPAAPQSAGGNRAVGVRFHLRFRGQSRRSLTGMSVGAAWAVASLLLARPAQAQIYTWGGTGSATTTTDYNLGTNWSNPPAGAPPVTSGQAAIFDAMGSATVDVTSAA